MGAYQIGGQKTGASISLSGLPELDAKFDKMEVKLRRSIGKKALRQATNVTLRYARQYVLKDTKALSKGLRTQAADLGKEARLAVIASKPEAVRIFETKLQSLIKAEEDKAVPGG